MAVLLTANDLHHEWPAKTVFNGVTLGVNTGERIGIVGRNGDGKSTLLHVLSGQLKPEGGEVITAGNVSVGMLDQQVPFAPSDIVGDIIKSTETDAYTWEADRMSRDIVDSLLGDVAQDAQFGTLSGGQQRRVDLARLLIGRWDMLCLDEPTNHLDLATINWLAHHLNHRWPAGQGALLVVTHDRWFLDEVCNLMWEVHDGQVDPFEGGYSAYVMKRLERERLAALRRQKHENQLRKELAFLSRGAQARRSKPKFHVETAQALIADVPPARNQIELKQMATARLGKQVLELNDVCVDIGGRRILSDITWNIGPGDRIGILGENGVGKTTLLNLLNGSLRPTLGHIKIGRSVQFATLSQNLSELEPVKEDIVRIVVGRFNTYYQVEGKKLTPLRMLERLGFTHDDVNSRVKDLSGGQRRRLQLLMILLEEPNVLVLDEPGNDLDTDMLAVTEDLLDGWPGTLIVVSHDRYFIERVTDDQYAILDTQVKHVPGGVDEYLSILRESSAATTSMLQTDLPLVSAVNTAGLSNAELHEIKKQIRSTERKMSTAQKHVEEKEAALDATDPYDFEALAEAQANLEEARLFLRELEDSWLCLSEAVEGA